MKKDNKGFSLVELLVAMTILAIIVAPLLGVFVLSAKLNRRARGNSNATTIAEDIMEGIKANTAEELVAKFDYPTADISKFDVISYGSGPNFLVDTANGGSVTELASGGGVQKSATPTGDGKGYEYVAPTDGKYYFVIDNIYPQTEKYVAYIELDANPYRDGDSGSSLSVNSTPVLDAEAIQKGADATYMQNSTLDDIMITNLQIKGMEEYSTDYQLDTTNPYINLYRKIVVDIEKDGENVKCTIRYEYTAKNVPAMPDLKADPQTVYTTSVKDLSSLMLFYCPLGLSRSGDVHDEIVINNKDDIPFEIYLVKQALLPTEEFTYRVNVAVNEKNAKAEPVTVIKSNIDEDIHSGSSKAVYTYNGLTGSSVRARLLKDFSASTTVKDRLYNVKVQIYKRDDITGYNFEEEKMIYELTGSTQE